MKVTVTNPPTLTQPTAKGAADQRTIKHYVDRQLQWSTKTFGPGDRTEGVSQHIQKELGEIAENPDDIEEWMDVLILGFDGAWRSLVYRKGFSPQNAGRIIAGMLDAKYFKNEARQWPDWRTIPQGQAIEHVRTHQEQEQKQRSVRRSDRTWIDTLRASLNSAKMAIQDDSYKINDRSIDQAALRDIEDALKLLNNVQNDIAVVAEAFEKMRHRHGK